MCVVLMGVVVLVSVLLLATWASRVLLVLLVTVMVLVFVVLALVLLLAVV